MARSTLCSRTPSSPNGTIDGMGMSFISVARPWFTSRFICSRLDAYLMARRKSLLSKGGTSIWQYATEELPIGFMASTMSGLASSSSRN